MNLFFLKGNRIYVNYSIEGSKALKSEFQTKLENAFKLDDRFVSSEDINYLEKNILELNIIVRDSKKFYIDGNIRKKISEPTLEEWINDFVDESIQRSEPDFSDAFDDY